MNSLQLRRGAVCVLVATASVLALEGAAWAKSPKPAPLVRCDSSNKCTSGTTPCSVVVGQEVSGLSDVDKACVCVPSADQCPAGKGRADKIEDLARHALPAVEQQTGTNTAAATSPGTSGVPGAPATTTASSDGKTPTNYSPNDKNGSGSLPAGTPAPAGQTASQSAPGGVAANQGNTSDPAQAAAKKVTPDDETKEYVSEAKDETKKFSDRADTADNGGGFSLSSKGTTEVTVSEDCATSEAVGGNGCSGTRSTIEGAKITNQVGQMLGSTVTQVAGQSQMAKLQANGGGINDSYKAQGEMLVLSGGIQVTQGAINTLFGGAQLVQSIQHKQNATMYNNQLGKAKVSVDRDTGNLESLEAKNWNSADERNRDKSVITDVGTGKGTALKINGNKNVLVSAAVEAYTLQDRGAVSKVNKNVTAAEIDKLDQEVTRLKATAATNPQDALKLKAATNRRDAAIGERYAELKKRDAAIGVKEDDVNSQIRKIATTAATEQKNVAGAAMGGSMTSLATGIAQLIQGGLNISAGNSLKNTSISTATGPTATTDLPAMDNSATNATDRTSQAISGTGATQDPTITAADGSSTTDTGAPLGTPFNPKGVANNLPPAPPSGKFTAGGSGDGGAGAGGGMAGGGGTSAATGDNSADTGARLAESNRNSNQYEGGGAYSGGGGTGSAAAATGPDLSGLLAKFLPTKEDANAKNDILDFAGRDPASERQWQNWSALDKNTNIFQRIHETYQEKHQHGFIGM